MRTMIINTGTELLLGDVLNTHLRFIAREIFPLGLRDRSTTDGSRWRRNRRGPRRIVGLDLVFVTGGLGPTSDDVTREAIAALLGLKLEEDETIANAIRHRLSSRGWKLTDRILRQALAPQVRDVLPNALWDRSGIVFSRELNPADSSPHCFCCPVRRANCTRCFSNRFCRSCATSIRTKRQHEFRTYRIAGMGESLVEEAVGAQILAIPGYRAGILLASR